MVMGCYSPITIKNSKFLSRMVYDKDTLSVPCGKCYGCADAQRQDWVIRSIYHHKKYISNGGLVLFVTFTYDNKHLPMFYPPEELSKFKGFEKLRPFSCFSKHHLDRFRDSFSKIFNRLGYVPGNDINGLTPNYIFCCEYGDSGTQRPHYHGLIFVPTREKSLIWLKSKITQLWPYGFVLFSSDGAEVFNEKAIKYCMKYVSKDYQFYHNPLVNDYLSFIDTLRAPGYSYSDPFSVDFRHRYLKQFKPFMPRHYQSFGYGLSILDELKNYDEETLFYKLSNGFHRSISENTKNVFTYSVPLYIKNKLLYNYHMEFDPYGQSHMVRTYNDLGKRYLSYSFNFHLRDVADRFEKTLTSFGCSSNSIDGLFDIPKLELPRYLRCLINNDIEFLAFYNLIYRGRKFSSDFFGSELPLVDRDYLVNNGKQIYLHLNFADSDVIYHEGVSDFLDMFPEFKNFEIVSNAIDKISYSSKKASYEARHKQDISRKSVKSSYHHRLQRIIYNFEIT